MRKHIKKQLTELLDTVKEAHGELSLHFYNGKINDIAEILTACQQAAISVGTSIEESEGEGTKTVTLLEEYCELLYNMHMRVMEDIESCDCNALTASLSDKINEVKESLDKDIMIKKEVVFLPYKSSMWDSLESVWLECLKDDMCDAYVVPIPYYDKNSDGTFGKFHYEIDKYPEDVPVVSCEEYNIAVRRPDVIFIHNPYDGINKVTSVHPDFYASNLKKHTDMLVYIPYFVCINDSVPEHFCVVPGTIHAHKVIVQSEKVKKQYIDVFTRELTEQGIDVKAVFGDLNDKFLALGSPKIDKVRRTTRESVKVPREWEEKINPQGKMRKKVMFYNTTLQSFMNNPDCYIDKMKAVFEIFMGRDDVVLLWRPHPLFEETLNAMYPYKLAEYKELVKRYIEDDFGIYDDTEDLHRAIAISDAYYGDYSSVVEMYKATKKPIMIQNVNMRGD